MAQVPSSILQSNKRVKVYELRNDDWFDFGTGFCNTTFVFNEATQTEEPRLFVYSEKEPDCTILDTKVHTTEGFKKQSETLIVWKESRTNLDMALSFQESDACSIIWKFVDQVQQQVHNLSNTSITSDDVLSDDITAESSYGPISLPTPSLASLPEVEMQMRGIQLTDQGRDALTKYILTEDYIQKLVPLVEMAEDMEDLTSLHHLCNIMKTMILLNDTTILELAVSDGVVMGVVGALEYDPDFPTHKANHRQWLAKDGRYKEVVHIDDDVCRKIHSTYRLQYLKDVVLARILDDPTFSVLNSLIFFNQVDIVQHLQSNPLLLKNLFGIFKAQQMDQKRKKEAVLFIQQCCAIGKTLQPNARQQLYDNFLSHGLLSVITFLSMIDHDPQMIRQTIFRQMNEKQTPLTDSLIELLLVEFDLGVKAQISDAIKVLLDISHNNVPQENSSKPLLGDCGGRLRIADPQQMEFIKEFYNGSAKKLFKPLVDLKDRKDMKFSVREVSLFIYLIEILCFFIRQHTHYSKFFVLSENLGQRIVQLLSSPEKYLKLSVVKFIRSLVGLQDDFYNQQIIQGNLLEPILDLIIESMPRDSLLNSAAFELFNFIGREKINNLTIHLVENYRDKMMKITNVDIFSYLITRYDSSQGFSIVHTDTEDETPALPRPPLCGRWESGLKDLDAQEEEYFNTSDEDEEETNGYPSPPEISNVTSPLKKPLVDYLSDEEDTIDCDPPREICSRVDENTPPRNLYDSPKSPCDGPRTASLSPSSSTPERLSEKRRREADEIDEIDKLSQANKRRNSMSSLGSNSILRRKKKFSNNPGSNSTKAKIAISISPVGKKVVETVKISDASIDSKFLESSG
ncbi:hypothetical protein EPUL_000843 [Erysiphe pulchra]|uniref:Uncharacterized protein n=1 Tax=Erysiphe pulchra TaxID=225359 RepID=A0A2S4PYJ2_9PEZI|nr:hypothetical protein EPUL_000843 [Erysiphe pulchra]